MERLLTADEVAWQLGLENPHTVYYLARSGELPYVRIGRRGMRFHQKDIDKYVESQTNQPFRLPTKEEREARKVTTTVGR